MEGFEKRSSVPSTQRHTPGAAFSAGPQGKQGRSGGANPLKKYAMLVLVVALFGYIGWQAFLYIDGGLSHSGLSATPGTGNSRVDSTLPSKGNENSAAIRPTIHYKRPNFEAGIVFPQWQPDSYGASWQQQLPAIQTQSGARWIEMTLFLSQATPTSTQVTTNHSVATVESFASGVRAAHALGYHVFVVPLMGVDSPPGSWAASVHFSNEQDEAKWFDSYWQTYQPYVVAAQQAGADQIAIATETVWLQRSAAPALWNTLIQRVRSVFTGILTYDMDWTTLNDPLPAWMKNPQLALIGVSEYIPLANTSVRVDPPQIFPMWKSVIKTALDRASIELGKPLVVSEIGYRNSADTLYHSWDPDPLASPPDPQEQAAAYDAALANVIPDEHIMGTFFWGWDNVGGFKLSGQQLTLGVLHKWYTSPQS